MVNSDYTQDCQDRQRLVDAGLADAARRQVCRSLQADMRRRWQRQHRLRRAGYLAGTLACVMATMAVATRLTAPREEPMMLSYRSTTMNYAEAVQQSQIILSML